MIVLLLVPLAVGYALLGPIYGAASRAERVAFGAALGLSLHLAILNLTWRLFAPTTAALVGTVALALIGGIVYRAWGSGDVTVDGWRPGRVELCLLGIALVGVLINTFMWQLVFRDDDLAVHYPLLGNMVRGEIPLRNPHFPELPYTGHYAKNLLVTLLSTLTPWSPFDFQVLFIPVLHTGATLVFFALLRANGTGPLVAATTTLFAWTAAEMELRTGMLETFQNNNSLVYFLFFGVAHLLLRTLRLRTPRAAIVTGLVLGTYQLVYETHFGILVLAFATTAAWLMLRERRAAETKANGFVALAGVVIVVGLIAGGLALVEGGAITNAASRWLQDAAQRSEDLVGLSQEVNVGFPKWPPRITSYYGSEYSPFSGRLLVECGPWVALLPLLAALFLWRGRSVEVFLTAAAIFGIAIPALVDFGRYNSDVYRFLFMSGVLAAGLAAGAAAGLARRLADRRRIWAVAIGIVLVVTFIRLSDRAMSGVQATFSSHPERRVLDTGTWSVRRGFLEEVDLEAVRVLREHAEPGARVLTWTGKDEDNLHPGFFRDAMYAGLSGTHVVGTGFVATGTHSMLASNQLKPAAMAKRAFFQTGRWDVLAGLAPRFVVLDPERFDPGMERALISRERFQLIERVTRAGATRTIWELDRFDRLLELGAGSRAAITELRLPERITSGRAYATPIRLALPPGTPAPHCLVLSYRLRDGEMLSNPLDTVPQRLCVAPDGTGGWSGEMLLVGALEPGSYGLTLWLQDRPLTRLDGEPGVWQIEVSAE